MHKTLLIGNGFTSNLISEYNNQTMIEALYKRAPELTNRIEKEFDYFRNLKFTKAELYTVIEGLFPREDLYPNDDLYPSDDVISITNNAETFIIEKLKCQKFSEPEKIFDIYFKTYGLIYLIREKTIIGIENYLKIVALFLEIGRFTKEEYNYIIKIANEICFNGGKHGKDHITNIEIDLFKLSDLLHEFDDIYTTNYDTILDDFLKNYNKFPYHIHGGFSINHRNKDPDGRYDPTTARLVWGTNPEEKYTYLSNGSDFGDWNFGAARFGQSRLANYLDFLKERQYEELYILGFSGENDGHINQRIKENQTIKRIIVYVNPQKMADIETQVRCRILFGCPTKEVVLKSWDEFWNYCK